MLITSKFYIIFYNTRMLQQELHRESITETSPPTLHEPLGFQEVSIINPKESRKHARDIVRNVRLCNTPIGFAAQVYVEEGLITEKFRDRLLGNREHTHESFTGDDEGMLEAVLDFGRGPTLAYEHDGRITVKDHIPASILVLYDKCDASLRQLSRDVTLELTRRGYHVVRLPYPNRISEDVMGTLMDAADGCIELKLEGGKVLCEDRINHERIYGEYVGGLIRKEKDEHAPRRLTDDEVDRYARYLIDGMRLDKRDGTGNLRYHEEDENSARVAGRAEELLAGQGIFAVPILRNDAFARTLFEAETPELLTSLTKLGRAVRVDLGRWIVELGKSPGVDYSGLEEKLALEDPKFEYIMRSIGDYRWCVFGIPIRPKKCEIPVDEYVERFYMAIEGTYAEETQRVGEFYHNALRNAHAVRIVSGGLGDKTDITFRIKADGDERYVVNSAGVITDENMAHGDFGMNNPDGEVFVAPIENSANGIYRSSEAILPGQGLVKDLELEFTEGRVVGWSGPEETVQKFDAYLRSIGGLRDEFLTIAEFGIGVNQRAEFTGDILVDEKLPKTVHVAIGGNHFFGGKTVMSHHVDFIKFMNPEGMRVYTIDADGNETLIMDSGNPVK